MAFQEWWRGHWGIENRLHWVRDVTVAEDASRIRTDGIPEAMAETTQHGKRVDYEYERNDTASIFMFAEPTHWGMARIAMRNPSLVRENECPTTRRQWAISHRKRPREIEAALPQN